MHPNVTTRGSLVRWLVAAAAAAAALVGPAAMASTQGAAQSAGLGSFSTWRAAQRAAGFGLLKPTVTFGDRRNGGIEVSKCLVRGEFGKRVVIVSYGLTVRTMFRLNQNNSGRPCLHTTRMMRLGTVTVRGARAALFGVCDRAGLPGCTARAIWLYLTWSRRHIYYVAASYGERRGTLVGFARGLVRVH
jgi:hypothetical protein